MKHIFDKFATRVARATDSLLHGDSKPLDAGVPGNPWPADADAAVSSRGDSGTSGNSLIWAPSMQSGLSPLEAAGPAGPASQSSPWNEAVDACFAQAGLESLALSQQLLVRIGALLWAARSVPRGDLLYITAGKKLIAVFDSRRLVVTVREDASADDLKQLVSQAIVDSPTALPDGREHYLWDIIWQYAQHDPEALNELPADIAQRTYQLRRLPSVSPALLKRRHTLVLRHLLAGNFNFDQLLEATQIAAPLLCRDVAALVLTRALKLV